MIFETKGGWTIVFSKVKMLRDELNQVVTGALDDGYPIMGDEEYEDFKEKYFYWLVEKETHPQHFYDKIVDLEIELKTLRNVIEMRSL